MKLRHVIVFFLLALGTRDALAATESIKYTLDTLCNGWNICIADDSPNGGVTKITIDKKSSNNVYLDSLSLIDIDGEINFSVAVKNACFRLYKFNSVLPTTVTIITQHKSGDVSSRQYFSTVDDQSQLEYTPTLEKGHSFLYQAYDSYNEKVFHIRSLNSSIKDVAITGVKLTGNNPNFSVNSLSDSLPVLLGPDESIMYWIAFKPKEVFLNRDTVIIDINCYQQRVPLFGGVNSPLISANDFDFGKIYVGESVCGNITIRNTGNLQLVVTDIDSSHRSANPLFFASNFPLPKSIGSSFIFQFCYTPVIESPSDSMVVKWITNIHPILLGQMKDSSIIRAASVHSKITWDRITHRFESDSNKQFATVYFSNLAPFGTFVKRFYISGKDSAEFRIHNSLSALSNVTMLRNETDWFDIAFKPDMTKPLSERYKDRHATLVAELKDSNVTMELIGTFNPLHVKHELTLEDFSFSPNPVYGQDATLSFTLVEPTQLAISIYDILGREVMSIPSQHYSVGSYNTPISTSKLVDGSYILRVSDGVLTKSISFRVQ